jgi:hypothetical protein
LMFQEAIFTNHEPRFAIHDLQFNLHARRGHEDFAFR